MCRNAAPWEAEIWVLTSSLSTPSTPSSRSSAHSTSGYYVLLLRSGIVQGSDYLIARVWLPCPLQHLVRSTMAVLAAESWTSASHTRSWRGPHEYRLRSALPFGTLHLHRTFPSCSLANPLHHPVHPHPRTVAKGTANSTRRSRGKGNSSLAFSALDAQPHFAPVAAIGLESPASDLQGSLPFD